MRRSADPYRQALREASKKQADFGLVRSLLERALKDGDPEAAYALGTWYLHGQHVKKDQQRAVALLAQAAQRNVANALYDLAVCHEKGAGTRRNPKRAVEFYLRAALQGEKQSIYEVGRCLYYGIGTARDTRLAWVWLDRAKELGVQGELEAESKAPRRKQVGHARNR